MLYRGEIERELLLARNALSSDENGAEVLRGLTFAESSFVLAVDRSAVHNIGAAESFLYRQLRKRHLDARKS